MPPVLDGRIINVSATSISSAEIPTHLFYQSCRAMFASTFSFIIAEIKCWDDLCRSSEAKITSIGDFFPSHSSPNFILPFDRPIPENKNNRVVSVVK